jgi:hypothetical protein
LHSRETDGVDGHACRIRLGMRFLPEFVRCWRKSGAGCMQRARSWPIRGIQKCPHPVSPMAKPCRADHDSDLPSRWTGSILAPGRAPCIRAQRGQNERVDDRAIRSWVNCAGNPKLERCLVYGAIFVILRLRLLTAEEGTMLVPDRPLKKRRWSSKNHPDFNN